MIITLKNHTPADEAARLQNSLESMGLSVSQSQSGTCIIFVVTGDTAVPDESAVAANPWVEQVTRIAVPYKKASRLFHPADSTVDVRGVKVGAAEAVRIIAGPCAVEGRESLLDIAGAVQAAGASMLRGGAFKPRTSPYAFQGLGREGIRILAEAREIYGLPIVTELVSTENLDLFAEYADLIQVGARNMQNFELLKALGRIRTPVLLKRGPSATVEEWLMAAEYILAGGNGSVILCERGIRAFDPHTRNTLDLSVIPVIRQLSHLPIVVDPSHATGDWRLVESMALAAVAAGADGLIIEVHRDPQHALSDGVQSLKPENFAALVQKAAAVAAAVERSIG